jgi:hypothetical protein
MYACFCETSSRLPVGSNINHTAVRTLNLTNVSYFIIWEINFGIM